MSLERRLLVSLLIAVALLASLPVAPVQAEDEPLLDRLRRDLKQDHFRVDALLQVVADAQSIRRFAGENGFSIANARVAIGGTLDRGFSYFLQANMVKSPALLDGRLTFRATHWFLVDAGQFKAPFSREFLTAASDIDFVNRSQVVTVLAPGRQIGLEARGQAEEQRWGYGIGVFNGNGIGTNGNDSGGVMGAARIGGRLGGDDRPFSFGLSVAASDDKAANLGATIGGEPLIRNFEGTRLLAGADARWTPSGYLVAAELIYGDIDPAMGDALDVWGLSCFRRSISRSITSSYS